MNYYIVIFDRESGASYKGFHAEFVRHPNVTRWFHYIQSSYIIGTDLGSDEVSEHFYATATKHDLPTTHLVVRVSLKDRSGRLTKDAWSWLQKNTKG
ncbi:MAG: hypothetical protein PHR35_15570 [Kiritimatiellae bacterium]|nr:hypothetical protein [Kiritimatiellia bacterium]